MDNRPIGIMDSGLGGLTAVREFKKLMPSENIIYFGDTARVPYGTRSNETVSRYLEQDLRLLLSHDVKVIVIACGTASSVVPPDRFEGFSVPVFNVLAPTAKAACLATRNGRIGIIATPVTIKNGRFAELILERLPEALIASNPCPLLVPLVESGHISRYDELTRLALRKYLQPVVELKADTLILGCTHYPLLSEMIGDILGSGVTLIDSGRESARRTRDYLLENNMQNDNGGNCKFYVSDKNTIGFSSIANILLGEDISENTEMVEIENF